MNCNGCGLANDGLLDEPQCDCGYNDQWDLEYLILKTDSELKQFPSLSHEILELFAKNVKIMAMEEMKRLI